MEAKMLRNAKILERAMGREGEMRSIKATKGFLMQDRSNGNPRTNANDILQAEYNANVIASFQGEVLASSVIPCHNAT